MKIISKAFILIAQCLLITACTADMLISPGDEYGPTDGPEIGRVRYRAEGASFVIEARRKDALKQMYEACDGHYRILDESSENKAYSVSKYDSYNGFVSDAGSDEYIYIKFECINE